MIKLSVRISILFVLMNVVASCSGASMLQAILPAPTSQEIEEAKLAIAELCATRNGTFVHRTVDGVEGFVSQGSTVYGNGLENSPTSAANWGCGVECLRYLVRGFLFVEAELQIPPGKNETKWDFVGAPAGLYRYELIEREAGRCDRFDRIAQSHGAVKALVYEYSDLLNGKCVVGLPISEFTSDYVYERYDATISGVSAGIDAYVHAIGMRFTERKSGEELALSSFVIVENSKFQRKHLAACEQPPKWLVPSDVLHPMLRNGGS